MTTTNIGPMPETPARAPSLSTMDEATKQGLRGEYEDALAAYIDTDSPDDLEAMKAAAAQLQYGRDKLSEDIRRAKQQRYDAENPPTMPPPNKPDRQAVADALVRYANGEDVDLEAAANAGHIHVHARSLMFAMADALKQLR